MPKERVFSYSEKLREREIPPRKCLNKAAPCAKDAEKCEKKAGGNPPREGRSVRLSFFGGRRIHLYPKIRTNTADRTSALPRMM